jgi:hypothetical protein
MEMAAERRRLRQRNRQVWMLVFFAGAMMVTMFAYVVGRAYFYMQDVSRFTSSLEQQSPAEVKAALRHYAVGLRDSNRWVRNGAMVAFKAATGKRMESDPEIWLEWWRGHEATWEYTPPPKE